MGYSRADPILPRWRYRSTTMPISCSSWASPKGDSWLRTAGRLSLRNATIRRRAFSKSAPNNPRETRVFPEMDRSSPCPFRPGKKERALFGLFPVLTTARAGGLKWPGLRCQCASIEIANPERLRTRVIDSHDKYLRRDQREGKPDSGLPDPDFRPSGRD